MPEPSLDATARLLQAVADPNRLRILGCLLVRPACVCELMQALRIPQPRISRHLRILRTAGLVQDRRDAQWVEYSVVSAPEGSPEACLLELVRCMLAQDPTIDEDRARLVTATRGCCTTPGAAGSRPEHSRLQERQGNRLGA
ncbi:MAG: winged helix-turn-helix transcriptional regulator [Armatimonadetes bacterium]|nr:winged helix-turn-helix transcriptional regulator [Armatimonadota bacterium]